MNTSKMKDIVFESLIDIKAVDPIAIDVQKLSSMTDYMLIASGTSNRHIQAISESVIDGLKFNKIKPVRVEGSIGDDWILVDAGDVIVHLMTSQARDFYDLEGLWDPDL
ncbi:MAG TPA: ribosome silencing factor [Gammaproteobacteria bacterium]|nr:ribosome silencing factor [Gammaproteobacteria bacterium]HIK72639.1 ribosome silencing factor [Gammaproteobacteria bacterium]|tara:strand:- start:463 stop:789 length:327 start_codon:yes stop_codon:yes gene_type:complete